MSCNLLSCVDNCWKTLRSLPLAVKKIIGSHWESMPLYLTQKKRRVMLQEQASQMVETFNPESMMLVLCRRFCHLHRWLAYTAASPLNETLTPASGDEVHQHPQHTSFYPNFKRTMEDLINFSNQYKVLTEYSSRKPTEDVFHIQTCVYERDWVRDGGERKRKSLCASV